MMKQYNYVFMFIIIIVMRIFIYDYREKMISFLIKFYDI